MLNLVPLSIYFLSIILIFALAYIFIAGLFIIFSRIIHKKLPETLSRLAPEILPELPVDPFTGKDFIYKSQNDKILLYSVGDNLCDDRITNFEKRQDDIVWKN
ncbi:MAG TPA: hypothetical protein PK303_02195 [bacterium]|nr:hypothetical protein [bacterium]HOL34840.1 hypothetical protein [bacterium]HPP07917.1 hypothetical protein [bacterium]